MTQNTTSIWPTHFLAGVELINKAGAEHSLPSENWAYPTEYRLGYPRDTFYAEVWTNGMDWQNNYWVIWSICENPVCEPLISFTRYEDEGRFKFLGSFIKAQLSFLRDQAIAADRGVPFSGDMSKKPAKPGVISAVKKPRDPAFSLASHMAWDEVWTFTWTNPKKAGHKDLVWTGMSHASQPPVEFWANSKYMPERVLNHTRPNSAIDPPNFKKIVSSILEKEELVPLLLGINLDLDREIEKSLQKPGGKCSR